MNTETIDTTVLFLGVLAIVGGTAWVVWHTVRHLLPTLGGEDRYHLTTATVICIAVLFQTGRTVLDPAQWQQPTALFAIACAWIAAMSAKGVLKRTRTAWAARSAA